MLAPVRPLTDDELISGISEILKSLNKENNMPHDRNGNLLEVEDMVMVPCRVKVITMAEDYCNLTVETHIPMPPNGTVTTITLNAKQVEKVK